MRRIILTVIIVVAALLAAAIYFNFDPSESRLFPQCIFYSLTGYKCPGCGLQRALHAVLHGDFAAVWHYNAALFFFVPVIGLYGASEFLRTKHQRFYKLVNSNPAVLTLLVAVMLWWVLRNVFAI